MIEMLLVGVDGHGDCAFYTQVSDSVHGVVSGTSATTNQDAWVGDTKRGNIVIE